MLVSLFYLATLLLDAVFVNLSTGSEGLGPWVLGFMLGQSAILGIWCAVGEYHRLARGALFVCGQAGLTLLICLCCQQPLAGRLWGIAIAYLSLYAAIAFVATWCWCFLLAKPRPNSQHDAPSLRFPLIEFFGWTIVVALGSLALRGADLSVFAKHRDLLVSYLGSAVLTGLAVTLFLPPAILSTRTFLLAAMSQVGCLLLIYQFTNAAGGGVIMFAVAQLHVACWLWVNQLNGLGHDSAKGAVVAAPGWPRARRRAFTRT